MYVYHATNQTNSLLILKDGFKKGTYFTPYLDSALVFGGEYVFAVWVDENDHLNWLKDDPNDWPWQFQIGVDWDKNRICSLIHYQAEMLFVKDENRKEGKCPTCHGDGEVFKNKTLRDARNWLPKTHFLHVQSFNDSSVCPECHGYGDVQKMKRMEMHTNGDVLKGIKMSQNWVLDNLNQEAKNIFKGGNQ